MKIVNYQDERGRWYRTRLPDDVPDDQASLGVLVGPPDVVDSLELPEEIKTRLHNELFYRGIWSPREARDANQLLGAVQAALGVDAQLLSQAYSKLRK